MKKWWLSRQRWEPIPQRTAQAGGFERIKLREDVFTTKQVLNRFDVIFVDVTVVTDEIIEKIPAGSLPNSHDLNI